MGQQLSLLAARGQLTYCPDEYKSFMMFLKQNGMKTEIQKEMMYNIMQAQASLGDKKAVDETKKDIMKFLFPEIKNAEESLFEEAKRRVESSDGTLRLSADPSKKLDPSVVNQQFNK